MAKSSGGAAVISKIKGAGRIRTPKGIAAFAYLKRPDTSFNKNRFRITVLFDRNDPEFKTFVKKMQGFNKLHGTETGRKPNPLPIKLADKKRAEQLKCEPKTPYMEFESRADGNNAPAFIPVFNAAGQQDDALSVWGGDVVRVETSIRGWELPTGVGIKGYLNAVQLLKSNHVSQTGATFESEDEFLQDELGESPDADEDADGFEDEGDSLFGDEAEETEEESEESEESEEDPTDALLG